jgi:putative peptidoglycan lipid II flippase
MVIGAAAYQFGIIFNTALAWTLPHGSVMYINAANRLIELPLAVLVMAISIAALPSLAALRGAGKTDEMLDTFRHALSLALAVATPAMIGLIVLAEPIVAVLYQRGHFGYNETLATAAGLRYAALGICAVALVRQTVPVFYAIENARVPMVMTIVFVVANALSGYILKGPFLHVGLCMAISISPTVQGIGLLLMLRRRFGPLKLKAVVVSWLRVLAAVLPMALAVWATARLGRWELGGNAPRNIGVLALAIVVGVGVYLASAALFRVPEILEVLRAINRRRRR